MKRLLLVVLMVAVAVPALAGSNPGIQMYVTFDAGTMVSRVDPVPYTLGNAYICMSEIGAGFTTVSFATDVDAAMVLSASWATMLPGGLVIGDFATGITLASTECMVGEIVCIAEGSFVWNGNPGLITILDHPAYPREVVDCVGDTDEYCVLSNGGVFMDAPPTGECISPVAESTWGGIKALYR